MLSSTTVRAAVQGSGSPGPFAFPFKIFAATDLAVYKTSSAGVISTLAYPTDYAVAGVGDAAGGTVTLTVALQSGETLAIVRAVPNTQPTSFRTAGTFLPATHEDAFDRVTMQVQEHEDALARSVHLSPAADPAVYGLQLTPETGKVLGWASATQLTNMTLDASAVALPGQSRTVTTLTAYLANNAAFNAKDYNALANGVANDGPAIATAAAQAGTGRMRLAAGTYRVSTNQTINAAVDPDVGAVLKPDNGVVITLTGQPLAGHFKWIDTSAGGQVVFKPKAMTALKPTWWGLIADYDLSQDTSNGTDNYAALQATAAAMSQSTVAHGWRIELPAGAARHTQGFVFTGSGVTIEGVHRESTWLVFDPTSDGQTAIKYARAGALEFFGGAARNFRLHSPGTNAFQKYGFDLQDMSEFIGEDIVINRWSSDTVANAYPAVAVNRQTKPSVGIRTRGREFIRLIRPTVFADRPIWIDNNLNYPGAPGPATTADLRIDCDTFHFSDVYLGTLAETEAAIMFYGSAVSGLLVPLVDTDNYGLNIQNFVLDGSNSLVGPGLHGIHYKVGAGNIVGGLYNGTPRFWHTCRSIKISGVRQEGVATTNGYFINIADEGLGSNISQLVIENCDPGLTHGIRLRGCVQVTIDDFDYSAVAASARQVLDIASCDNVIGRNVKIAAGANNQIVLGTMRKAWALGQTATAAIEQNFLLVAPTNHAHLTITGDDPDNGSASIEISNLTGRLYRLIAGIPGVSNSGFTLKDMTGGLNVWHATASAFVMDMVQFCSQAFVHATPIVVPYSASMTFNANSANDFIITATNATAFAINAPTNPSPGQIIRVTISNTSGGALNATNPWNAIFKMSAWTSPATANSRTMWFRYNGTNWVEIGRTPADVPN